MDSSLATTFVEIVVNVFSMQILRIFILGWRISCGKQVLSKALVTESYVTVCTGTGSTRRACLSKRSHAKEALQWKPAL